MHAQCDVPVVHAISCGYLPAYGVQLVVVQVVEVLAYIANSTQANPEIQIRYPGRAIQRGSGALVGELPQVDDEASDEDRWLR